MFTVLDDGGVGSFRFSFYVIRGGCMGRSGLFPSILLVCYMWRYRVVVLSYVTLCFRGVVVFEVRHGTLLALGLSRGKNRPWWW